MRRRSMSWTTLSLATAFAIPTLFTISAATAKTASPPMAKGEKAAK